MTNETNDQVTRDAAAILAELMDAVDALAESWRGRPTPTGTVGSSRRPTPLTPRHCRRRTPWPRCGRG